MTSLFQKEKTVNRVVLLDVSEILPNPAQPRTSFDPDSLASLAQSIRQNGVLQPVTVRKNRKGCYELIAGERRLRAAKIAGLVQIPSIIMETSEKDSAVLALLENLQRQDLNFFEQATALSAAIVEWNITQEEAAARLSMAQSTIANKIRLSRIPPEQQARILDGGLTERHARALLRLEDPEQRLAAVEHIGKNQLNVAYAEGYIDRLVAQNQTTQPRRRSAYIIKDVRLFLNSVDRGVRLMQTAGVGAKVSRRDTEDAICLTVTIPRAKPQKDVS